MDVDESAAKFSALFAELAAKSSRIAELEARVSFLEAQNAGLREALVVREAKGRAGAEGPISHRSEAGLGGSSHAAVETLGGSTACGVIEVSDDEEVAAADANKRRGLEEGVVAVPTPRQPVVVTRESDDEADVVDAEGGGGSNMGNSADLEDDDVSVTQRGKKRARVVTSDSEDDDGVNGSEFGGGKDDADDQEGVTPARKRRLFGTSDSENEDAIEGVHVLTSKGASRIVATRIESEGEEEDTIPIRQLRKKMRKHDDEFGEVNGCSTPVTRRSARSARIESEGEEEEDTIPICQLRKKMRKHDDEFGEVNGCSTPVTRRSARLVKKQSKGGRARSAIRALNFVEPKEYEESGDDMEEDDDMDGFINDEGSSENSSDSDEESCDEPEASAKSVLDKESSPGPEESDCVVDYADVMARIGRKKEDKDWKFEGDMLAAFDKHPELCLKAVCALYRKQTLEEQLEKATFVHNKQGFNQIDAPCGSRIAEFLLDGDFDGPLKKNIQDLEEYDHYALEFCRKVASRYSKQLFAIYQNKEDPYFHP